MNAAERRVLFDFAGEDEARNWRSINDVVMGGRSRGQIVWDDQGLLVFTGTVSFERGGGFASVASPPVGTTWTDWEAVEIHALGDGKSFKCTVRTDTGMDGVSYQHRFHTTAGKWKVYTLPLREFVPAFHGRVLEDGEPLDPKKISRIGFIIADQQEGPFSLSVRLVTLLKSGAID